MSLQTVQVPAVINGILNVVDIVLSEGEFENPFTGEVVQVSAETPVTIAGTRFDCIATTKSGKVRLANKALVIAMAGQ